MLSLKEVTATHPDYTAMATQANYLYKSYVGGATYRSGEYLTKYIGEESAPGDQYAKRLYATPLDNHVQTTIDIYRSFLFRDLPHRTLGILERNPLVLDFVSDADMEGQGLDSFLKTANDLAMVLGSTWILIDKGSYQVQTQAEEIALGLRAYAVAYTPQNVLDWNYEREISGKVRLTHIKVLESDNSSEQKVTIWTPESVEKYTIQKDELGNADHISDYAEYANPLGYVPFVQHTPLKSPVRGIGHSLVADVADGQRYVYNLLSELEQTIRISGHPTLVKTPSTTATAGAGGIVSMQEDMDPGLKPYLLEPSGAGITGILSTINSVVESMQRMTHTNAVQATKGTAMSGVALKVEQNLLNAKLADLSDTLRETELKVWQVFMDWQNLDWPADFDVEYANSFDIEDEHSEIELLRKAIEINPDPEFVIRVKEKVAQILDK